MQTASSWSECVDTDVARRMPTNSHTHTITHTHSNTRVYIRIGRHVNIRGGMHTHMPIYDLYSIDYIL